MTGARIQAGLFCASALVLAATALPADASGPAAGSVAPSVAHVDQGLTAVSADSRSDAWAIGYRGDRPVVKHWDGATWASVPVQQPGTAANELHAVDALSPTDVWVVGEYGSGSGDLPLVEHWDGTGFTVVPILNPSSQSAALWGISAVSSTNIWAVGDKGGADPSLIEHWDGTRWRVVASPTGGTQYVGLAGVTAISRHDVWASGANIDHWNGRRWRVVTTLQDGSLTDLSGDSATDVWGVGPATSPDGFAEHWDGNSWSLVLTSCSYSDFGGVAAVAADDVWVVGECTGQQFGHQRVAIYHWNGSTWRHLRNPHPGQLSGVSAVSANNAWAVGSHFTKRSSFRKNLIEHWDGTSWTAYRATG